MSGRSTKMIRAGAAVGGALASLVLAVPVASAATYHASPTGSDDASGTAEQPFRSLDRLFDELEPGDTAYLHAGSYGARGTVVMASLDGTASAPITVRGYPGEPRPEIHGHFKITGDHLHFSELVFDGPTGPVKPPAADNPKREQVQVAVNGDGVTIERSVVRDSEWHAGIYLSGAENARILDNCISNNGDRDPAVREYQWNKSHGLYWSSGSGVVAGNLVDSNLARGIQLYESPHDVSVSQNVVVDNGRAGIQFASKTRDSLAERNIVAFNGDTGLRTHSLSGRGNVARDNVGYGNANGNFYRSEAGMSFYDNVVADPSRQVEAARQRCKNAVPPVDRDAVDPPPTDPEPENPPPTDPEPENPPATDAEPETPPASSPEPETPPASSPEPETPPASSPEPREVSEPSISFRGSAFRANRGGRRLVLPAVRSVRPGDTLLATVDVRGRPRISPPRGWTLVRQDRVRFALTKAVYRHRVRQAEPSRYRWRFSKRQSAAGGVLAYGGVDPSSPVVAHESSRNNLSRAIVAPSVLAQPDTVVVGLFGTATRASIRAPDGMVERGERAVRASRYKVTSAAADVAWQESAQTGRRWAAASKSGHNIGQTVVLRAAR